MMDVLTGLFTPVTYVFIGAVIIVVLIVFKILAPGRGSNFDNVKDLGDSAKDSKPDGKLIVKFDILRGVILGLFGVFSTSALFFILNEVPTLDFITLTFCMIFSISAIIYAYDSPVDNDQDQDGDE